MTKLEVSRRQLMRLGMSVGVTAIGGSMMLRAHGGPCGGWRGCRRRLPRLLGGRVPEHRGSRADGGVGR